MNRFSRTGILLSVFIFLTIWVPGCDDPEQLSPFNPRFVSVGGGGNTTFDRLIRCSEDGMFWDDYYTYRETGSALRGVTYGNGLFVAVGLAGQTLHSEDGINWDLVQLSTTDSYNDIAYGEYHGQTPWTPYYVAVGNNGNVIYSSDGGQSWSGGNSGTSLNLWGITFGYTTQGLSTFVTVGDVSSGSSGAVIKYSLTAGQSWINHSSGGSQDALFDVAYGNGRFIAVGENGAILYSSNVAAWTMVRTLSSMGHYGVVYGNGIWVAAGEIGQVSYSLDNGNTWTYNQHSSLWYFNEVVYGAGTFVAVGDRGIIYSTDGINWNIAYSYTGQENYLWGAAYGAD